ncbi:hypothetical protein NPIL_146681 [Nephila pilipes]|uniref:Uncharacterized protein n=1 Tax=Nephila pilipes TaxID=299642 RepID=A0A8X6N1L3_NEPPI|nr:hypothetical protein NPIL_630471 [Nephila pilipes]GFU18132.1 hypothetical protein NPIL_146681 [Nephila pilipes]
METRFFSWKATFASGDSLTLAKNIERSFIFRHWISSALSISAPYKCTLTTDIRPRCFELRSGDKIDTWDDTQSPYLWHKFGVA